MYILVNKRKIKHISAADSKEQKTILLKIIKNKSVVAGNILIPGEPMIFTAPGASQ